MGYEMFPMMELHRNLSEVMICLSQAMDDLVPECLAEGESDAYFKQYPERKDLQDKLANIYAQVRQLWTPQMRERLAGEQEQYQRYEDMADAQSY